jgi:hypothetical protein
VVAPPPPRNTANVAFEGCILLALRLSSDVARILVTVHVV